MTYYKLMYHALYVFLLIEVKTERWQDRIHHAGYQQINRRGVEYKQKVTVLGVGCISHLTPQCAPPTFEVDYLPLVRSEEKKTYCQIKAISL